MVGTSGGGRVIILSVAAALTVDFGGWVAQDLVLFA